MTIEATSELSANLNDISDDLSRQAKSPERGAIRDTIAYLQEKVNEVKRFLPKVATGKVSNEDKKVVDQLVNSLDKVTQGILPVQAVSGDLKLLKTTEKYQKRLDKAESFLNRFSTKIDAAEFPGVNERVKGLKNQFKELKKQSSLSGLLEGKRSEKVAEAWQEYYKGSGASGKMNYEEARRKNANYRSIDQRISRFETELACLQGLEKLMDRVWASKGEDSYAQNYVAVLMGQARIDFSKFSDKELKSYASAEMINGLAKDIGAWEKRKS